MAVAAVIICCFLAWFIYLQLLRQDTLWKWKVRKKINPNELRAWAFQVISNTQPRFDAEIAQTMLTNAPAYIAHSYRYRPSVVPTFNCVHVRYGGGFYSWGLTIGDTNLTGEWARGHPAEEWAPGVYYWTL